MCVCVCVCAGVRLLECIMTLCDCILVLFCQFSSHQCSVMCDKCSPQNLVIFFEKPNSNGFFSLQAKLCHDNIVPLLGVVEGTNHLVIVTPYFEFGCLKDYLQECGDILDVQFLNKFGLDVAKGMEYLASIKLVHRDVAVSSVSKEKKREKALLPTL